MKTILVCFLLLVVPAGGSRFWEDKAYTQWSQRECDKMLTDSPWAKTYTAIQGMDFVAQFRSAQPIREAMVRQMQMAANYDDLSLKQRQEFDRQSEEFLSQQFTDLIVVNVKYSRRHGANWVIGTTAVLDNSVFLIVENIKIPLLKYFISPETFEWQFIFPRRYKEQPVLSRKDEFISLEFPYLTSMPARFLSGSYDLVANQPRTALLEFNVSEMLMNGEIQY